MEIQKNISATMKRKLREYRNQTEFARELGIGHTTLQNLLAGRGNPNADTIELLARGMDISPAQLVSGEAVPTYSAFDLVSNMVETLHPTLQAAGFILMDELYQLLQLSDKRYAEETYWKYAVTEPRPFCYAVKVLERSERGWIPSVESEIFTNDHSVAKAAAELFTRNSLSPIHLEEAIEDYMSSL